MAIVKTKLGNYLPGTLHTLWHLAAVKLCHIWFKKRTGKFLMTLYVIMCSVKQEISSLTCGHNE